MFLNSALSRITSRSLVSVPTLQKTTLVSLILCASVLPAQDYRRSVRSTEPATRPLTVFSEDRDDFLSSDERLSRDQTSYFSTQERNLFSRQWTPNSLTPRRPTPRQPVPRRPIETGPRFPDELTPTNYRVPTPDVRERLSVPRVQPTTPVRAPQQNYSEIRQQIASRYSNPKVIRLAQTITADRGIALYREAAQLVDSRHIAPTTYETRVKRAVLNLVLAVEDPAFQRANRLNATPWQVQQFQQILGQTVQRHTIRTANDALNVMYSSMRLGQQHLNLNPGVVALEFVYGTAETLDKYSTFEPANRDERVEEEEQQKTATLNDHVVGIGVEIERHSQGLRIVKLTPGGPAKAAGFRTGDVIVTVNGQPLAGKHLNTAVELITGPEGSTVMIGLSRDNRAPSLVTLVRKRIPIYTVTDVRMLDGVSGVGYLKLTRFSKSSAKELDAALWKLYQQGMKTLVFDVRGNPGGLLTSAIDISNRFLPCGTIVSTRGRTQGDNSKESASYQQTWKFPVVVMIDKNSASASEIFAAAIQENKRGLVVGERSYGKGTVQTHFPIRSVPGTFRLTTARFFSPQGRMIAGSGVAPDVSANSTVQQIGYNSDRDEMIAQALRVARSRELQGMALAAAQCRTRMTPDRPTYR